ncbi:MAG: glycosyltransferase family 9 protein [Candidatus Omnitrophota bacterium]
MNISIAKAWDYWLGIPVCFVLSVWDKAGKLFSLGQSEKGELKKIMFIEFSEMGSVVLAQPAINKAIKEYKNSEFYFWTFKENQDIISLLNIIPEKNIITIRTSNLLLLFKDILDSIRRIQKEKIDAVVDMELFSRFSGILSYLSGAKVRVGFHKYKIEGLYRGNLHTHKVQYNPYFHISKNFSFLVDSLNVCLEDVPLLKSQQGNVEFCLPKLQVSDQDKDEAWERIKSVLDSPVKPGNDKESGSNIGGGDDIGKGSKIIIVHFSPNDKIDVRRWPLEYYCQLIEKILENQGIFVVIAGIGPADTGFFLANERCVNLIGKTTVKELISLFSIAHVLISYDSGISHLACLTNIHIITLFGPESPLLYGPLTDNKKVFYKKFACSPCLSAYNHRSSVCKDNKCMRAITVDEVYEEAVRIIQQ